MITVEFPDEASLRAAVEAVAARHPGKEGNPIDRAERALDSALLHHEQSAAEDDLTRFKIEVLRTVAVTVEVSAITPGDAVDVVKQHDFPLPSVDDGQVLDSYEFVVYDITGNEELYRED